LGFDKLTNPNTHLDEIAVNGTALVIAPGDLHKQICDEARDKFMLKVTPIPNQAAFNALTKQSGSALTRTDRTGRAILPKGFYITSYTQLTTNGVNGFPNPDKLEPRALLEWLCLKLGDTRTPNPDVYDQKRPKAWTEVAGFFDWRGVLSDLWRDDYDIFKLDARTAVTKDLDKAYDREVKELNDWSDIEQREARMARLERSREVLENLVPSERTGKWQGCTYVCLADLTPKQQDFVIREFCRQKIEEYSEACGTIQSYPIGPIPNGYIADKPETDTRIKWRIKCVAYPSLADLSYDAFDAVSIDEGVKMKGEFSQVGMGVRSMEPRYRLIATGTPIKNRLPDIFRLAWWAAGGKPEAHARFPYRDDSSESTQFAKTFLIGADIQGYNSDGTAKQSRTKVTAEVCNIHRLWKLMGPLIIRRRMEDCEEDIIKAVRKVYRCQMGTEQRKVYEYHLHANYLDKNGMPAIGAQLQALRQAAVAPATPHLMSQGAMTELCPACKGEKKAASNCEVCDGQRYIPLPHRAQTNYVPKIASVLSLIQECMDRKEQVVVFSAFKDPNEVLSKRLEECGVRHLLLDGDTSQKKRGVHASQFKAGPLPTKDNPITFPVLLAGIECMAEGHSFDKCRNVILYAYSWAYDKFKQSLARVRRLTSKQDVNVYVVLCDGTIDARLESLTQEKGDTADLVLDGSLMNERPEEVSFAELLQVAHEAFKGDHNTLDEIKLEREWPQLRHRLGDAQADWDFHGVLLAPALYDADVQTPAMKGAARKLPIIPSTPQPLTIVTPPIMTPMPASTNWHDRLKQRAALLQRLAA
jgi:hypothetical protein